MKVIIKGKGKEIAALVLAVQERQKISPEGEPKESEREQLIRVYKRRIARLKSGASPRDVIFKV